MKGQGPVHIHNIYNPNPRERSSTDDIRDTVRKNLLDEHIVLDDFNLHHPVWEGQDVVSEEEAEELIYEMESLGIDLVLPPGTITYVERGSVTIDLSPMRSLLID